MVPAFRSSEDTGLLRDLNAVSTGYFIGEPGLHYRVWPGQTTAQRVSDDERKAVLRLVGMRADELLDAWAPPGPTATPTRSTGRSPRPSRTCSPRVVPSGSL